MAKSRLHFANRLSKDCSPFTRKQVYLGVKTCEGFICFVAIVRVCYVDFFVFFVTGEFYRFLHQDEPICVLDANYITIIIIVLSKIQEKTDKN